MTNGTSAQDALVESFALEGPNGPNSKSSWILRATGGRWVQIAYVLMDVLLVSFGGAFVFYLRFVPDLSSQWLHPQLLTWPELLSSAPYAGFLLLYLALIVLFCQSQDLYRTVRTRSPLAESFAVAKAVTLATLLLTAFIYLSGVKTISRLVVGLTGLLSVFALASWRLWKHKIVKQRVAQGYGARNVLIVGAGRIGQALARYLSENKQLGYIVKGFLDRNKNGEPHILGRTEDLSKVALAHFIDDVFITIPSQREVVSSVVLDARRRRLGVKVIPELYDGLGWRAPIRYLGDFPVMELHWEPIPALGLSVKRLLDIIASLFGLLALSPLLVLIAMVIKLDSPGPALYRSRRVGKKGRVFDCYKFRSMVVHADDLKNKLRNMNERNGPFFKISNDPRVTRVGRLLRKYSLDELPQLWNMLRGEMSLVGPRPHPLDDFERYNLSHFRRLDVKPGITGLWQVTARQDPAFETNMALDLEYIENWNLWLDFKVLLGTIPAIMRGDGQ